MKRVNTSDLKTKQNDIVHFQAVALASISKCNEFQVQLQGNTCNFINMFFLAKGTYNNGMEWNYFYYISIMN